MADSSRSYGDWKPGETNFESTRYFLRVKAQTEGSQWVRVLDTSIDGWRNYLKQIHRVDECLPWKVFADWPFFWYSFAIIKLSYSTG